VFPPRLKRNQIVLAVFLILSVGVLTLHWRLGTDSFFNQTQRVVVGLTGPLQSGFSKITRPFKNGLRYVREMGSLRRDNTRMKGEVTKLREEVISLREAKRENKRLKQLAGFKEDKYTTLAARIIGNSPNNWQATVVIDKGSAEGVALRMPVVSGEGLVGQISKVSSHVSEVQLILDQKSGVGAQIQKRGEKGIIQGDLDKEPKLNFISKDSRVKKGEAVITSGLGGIFPKGILIGFTSEVKLAPYSMYKEIKVTPIVKFSRLEEVLVITNPQPKIPWKKE